MPNRLNRMLATLALVFPAVQGLAASPAMFRGDPAHLGVYASADAPTLATAKWKFKHRRQGDVFAGRRRRCGLLRQHRPQSVRRQRGGRNAALEVSRRTARSTRRPPSRWPRVCRKRSTATSTRSTRRPESASGTSRRRASGASPRRESMARMPRTEMMPDPFDVFLSSPVVAGGIVYFGSGDHNVYALDARTGALAGSSRPATSFTLRRRSPTASSTSAAGTAISTRSTRPPAHSSGNSRRATTRSSTTRSASRARPRSPAASCSSAAATGTSTRSMRRPARCKWKHDNKMGWVIASPAVRERHRLFSDVRRHALQGARRSDGHAEVRHRRTRRFRSPRRRSSTTSPISARPTAGCTRSTSTTGAMKAEFQTRRVEGERVEVHRRRRPDDRRRRSIPISRSTA